MSSVEEIEAAVRSLGSPEHSRFRDWIVEFEAALWDKQLESDIADGELDALADRAISANRSSIARFLGCAQ